ncbi:FAD binding domain protein, partial [Metarhizium majus ARSEF 297]
MSFSDSTGKRPFRVVVVGAGVAGLVLSNALQRAGIGHIVLEKHKEIVWPSGASIGIWPNGCRLLDQLGCLEAVQNACAEMTVFYTRDPDGKAVTVSKLFDEIVKSHGCRFLLLERKEFLRHLYECLPSKNPIKTGYTVNEVSELTDSIMWYNANKAVPNTITDGEMKSLATSYKCLVGVSTPIPGVEPSALTVVHNDGFSFLLLVQPYMIFFFVFIKQDKTYHWPAFPKYTKGDINMQATSLALLLVNDTVLFRDIWAKRIRADLVNVEEGIFQHWHSGRIVLVGDAARKLTPNLALGGMCAIKSAASLVNLVRANLTSSPRGLSSHPSQQELSTVFQAYRDQRISRVAQIFRISALTTREQAWDNLLYKAFSKYILPHMSDARVASVVSDVVKGAVKLDFVPLRNRFEGTVQWEDGPGKLVAMTKRTGVMVAFGLALLIYAVYCYGGIVVQS